MTILRTGLAGCYDSGGAAVDCAGSGQDAALTVGLEWPEPRFEVQGEAVRDLLTGLYWSRNANPLDFPLSWSEALDNCRRLAAEGYAGRTDWRLPNRRELRSLISHGARIPALPEGHPFTNVFIGWRWTSTTSAMAPRYAWYVHLEGGRMFYGRKDAEYLVWPVAGESSVLARTGQNRCFGPDGMEVPCSDTGQDGEVRAGAAWPEPRFSAVDDGVRDELTGLVWAREADLASGYCTWDEALEAVAELDRRTGAGWRLPNINELESLVDASRHSPALPEDHLFTGAGEAYWSSTTSFYETDWAYCLYLHKGAVGVGHKPGKEFLAWPVRGERE